MSCDQPEDTKVTNIERLCGHLKDGTLAAKLVETYRGSAPEQRPAALKAIVEARLAEIRAALVTEKFTNASD